MKYKIICSLFLLSSFYVNAQDSAKTLNEVIVTATKSPIKQSETGKVVNIITQEQLQKSFGKTLSEVMNQLPGITINGATNNLGTNETVYTRGSSSSNTLILLDGIPLYDPSGIGNEFDLNNFALQNIERIEIVKGSQSTLYGSDAVAGVINIISKKGEKKPFNLDVNLSAGSYNTYKAAVSVSGTNGNGQTYFVSYNKIKSKGFSSAYDSTGKNNFDKDGFNQDLFQVNYSFKPLKKTSVHLFAKYNNNHADIDAGAFADDKDYTYQNDNTILGSSLDYKLSNGFIRLQYNYNRYNRNFLDDSASIGGLYKYQRGKYNGTSHFAELFTHLDLSSNVEFLAGIDYRRNATSQLYIYLPDYGFPSVPLSADSAKTDQFSGYVSVSVKAKKGFNIELGSRWNHHNIYGTNYTSSINPFFLIKDKYKIYASISSGYRVPSLYQLYSEFGNKDLKPETTTSYETGVQYFSDKLNARITGFIRDGRDVFLFSGMRYANGDKQNDYGIETEATLKLADNLSVVGNYTFVNGKVSTETFTGKDTSFFNLYKRPKNVLNLSLNWQAAKTIFLSTNFKTASKAFDGKYQLNAYYTIGFYAQYQLDKKFSIFTDLENITNRKYFETIGFNTKGFNINAGAHVSL